LICAAPGETCRRVVKLTFAQGAAVDAVAFEAQVLEAIGVNRAAGPASR